MFKKKKKQAKKMINIKVRIEVPLGEGRRVGGAELS